MGKGSNSAATRKMIADEGHTLKCSHLVVSRRPFVGTVFVRVSEVGTCTSCGRPASIAPDCLRRCSRCGAWPPPVYATRPTMPMVPACMLTWSDCMKTAPPMVTSNDPVRTPPLRTRSQVSRSAPRHQAEFGGRSIFSNTKCGLETRRVHSLVSRFGCTRKSAGSQPPLRFRYEVHAADRDQTNETSHRRAESTRPTTPTQPGQLPLFAKRFR